jgi:hypothetical protein
LQHISPSDVVCVCVCVCSLSLGTLLCSAIDPKVEERVKRDGGIYT